MASTSGRANEKSASRHCDIDLITFWLPAPGEARSMA